MICFLNSGILDLRALRAFGVSAKETKNPIGMFGTGLKYALAILAREGCKVEMYLGLDRYKFSVSPQEIRGQHFDFIQMNGEDLGFTTQLGKNWELWQAFRELYCNAIDENGAVITDETIDPAPDTTLIRVDGEAFSDVYRRRHEIILEGAPRWKNAGMEIHDRPSAHLYYQGVRVGEFKRPASLTYNITGRKLMLTEDRTVAWPWEPPQFIREAIITSDDEALIRAVICAPPDTVETAEIVFSEGHQVPSETFMHVMETMPFRDVHNFTAIQAYKKASGKMYAPDPQPLDAVETEQLRRAIVFLAKLGYRVDMDPIVVTSDLPENIWGCVYERTIYLNRRIFMLGGTKQVASTLFEEHLHLRHNLNDETREMQNYLFDLVISFAEKVNGEPL